LRTCRERVSKLRAQPSTPAQSITNLRDLSDGDDTGIGYGDSGLGTVLADPGNSGLARM
jgi:hypothetical protein